jgi:hypothetical protein
MNNSTTPIGFTVSDDQTPSQNLIITASSTNQTLIPDANIIISGAGSNRQVTITPMANQSGETLITSQPLTITRKALLSRSL